MLRLPASSFKLFESLLGLTIKGEKALAILRYMVYCHWIKVHIDREKDEGRSGREGEKVREWEIGREIERERERERGGGREEGINLCSYKITIVHAHVKKKQ